MSEEWHGTRGSEVTQKGFPLRSVNFRLAEEDYARLQDVCRRRGIRNISLLLRAVVKWMIDNGEKDLIQLLGFSGNSDAAERSAEGSKESQVASFQIRMDSIAREFGTLCDTLKSREAERTVRDSLIDDAGETAAERPTDASGEGGPPKWEDSQELAPVFRPELER